MKKIFAVMTLVCASMATFAQWQPGTGVANDHATGANAQDVRFVARDGVNGYGYQMWMCPEDAYRADGAFGQYIMIWPSQDAVITITASSQNLQKEQDLIYKYIFPAIKALQ